MITRTHHQVQQKRKVGSLIGIPDALKMNVLYPISHHVFVISALDLKI